MLLAEPNEHQTTLEGNKLWQVALLELWLERHIDGARISRKRWAREAVAPR